MITSKMRLPAHYKKLWKYIPAKRRFQAFGLAALMMFKSFAEVLSIGAIIPFIAFMLNPQDAADYPLVGALVDQLTISSPEKLQIFGLTIFLFSVIFAGAVKALTVFFQFTYCYLVGSEISTNVLKSTVYRPYQFFMTNNSSELVSAITLKSHSIVYQTLLPIAELLSSGFLLLMISLGVISLVPTVAVLTMLSIAIFYFTIGRLVSSQLKIYAQISDRQQNNIFKVISETILAIKEIKIGSLEASAVSLFQSSDFSFRSAKAKIQLFSILPRHLIETLILMVGAIVTFIAVDNTSTAVDIAPLIGALALAAQKTIPAANNLYRSWVVLKGEKNSLVSVLDFIEPYKEENQSHSKINFEKSIRLSEVNFQYDTSGFPVVEDMSFSIKKGEFVGFRGKTGSGKSTILMIVIGLLTPSSGSVLIDNKKLSPRNLRNWQHQLALVPQKVFLFDATVAENIAFGSSEKQINMELMTWAAKKAEIYNEIIGFTNGFNTAVGENGAKLSGGQAQRIAIARALYSQKPVLIFDEATSALDEKTESKILKNIATLKNDKTVLMITHNDKNFNFCDVIVDL